MKTMIIDSHARYGLPRVIDEIAALKGIDRGTVERVIAENVQKLFRLP